MLISLIKSRLNRILLNQYTDAVFSSLIFASISFLIDYQFLKSYIVAIPSFLITFPILFFIYRKYEEVINEGI